MPKEIVPEWAKGLTAEPEAKHFHHVDFRSDETRIADARLKAIAHSKATNAPGAGFGFGYHDSYYQDGAAGNETSRYAFEHMLYMLYFLEDPKFGTAWLSFHFDSGYEYNSQTGLCTHGREQMSIQTLKDAVSARITELEIEEVLVLEYLAESHSIDESNSFNSLPFSEKMQRFHAVAQEK